MLQTRDVVVEFYSGLYRVGPARSNEFLCEQNDILMHPVLTPNFYCGRGFDRSALVRDRLRFLNDFAQSQHWLQLFPDQVDKQLLEGEGYRPTMTCAFNVFTRPLLRQQKRTVDVHCVEHVPTELRAVYEQKTEANCHNLPVAILRKIEAVLRLSHGEVSHALATTGGGKDERNLIGALTKVRVGTTTLFINAWVDLLHRGHGIMRQLFSAATAGEFAEGQTAVFYWTLNPIIAAKGDQTDQVTIYCNWLS